MRDKLRPNDLGISQLPIEAVVFCANCKVAGTILEWFFERNDTKKRKIFFHSNLFTENITSLKLQLQTCRGIVEAIL